MTVLEKLSALLNTKSVFHDYPKGMFEWTPSAKGIPSEGGFP
jgi:hypothetical protein